MKLIKILINQDNNLLIMMSIVNKDIKINNKINDS